VSLGMALESSAHSACLPCNPPSLPPSSLPQVSLLENSRHMSAGEHWACRPGDEHAAWPQHVSRPRGRDGAGKRVFCWAILHAELDPRSPGQGSGCLSLSRGVSLTAILSHVVPSPQQDFKHQKI